MREAARKIEALPRADAAPHRPRFYAQALRAQPLPADHARPRLRHVPMALKSVAGALVLLAAGVDLLVACWRAM